jgi:hypothetical protein
MLSSGEVTERRTPINLMLSQMYLGRQGFQFQQVSTERETERVIFFNPVELLSC